MTAISVRGAGERRAAGASSRRGALLAVVALLLLPLGIPEAAARRPGGRGVAAPVAGPMAGDDTEHAHDQHGTPEGHLPASHANVELVGRLKLTDVRFGIADVAAHGRFAYLNAFAGECAGQPGAHGTGVHVVDISDPAHPAKVGFIPAHPNSNPGEGIHVQRISTPFFSGDVLVHNNEPCDGAQFSPGGVSLWDVTDPLHPRPLTPNAGDATPPHAAQRFHYTHSAQIWAPPGRAYVAMSDDQERQDVDILDITDPRNPRLVAEYGIEDWPPAPATTGPARLGRGSAVLHHDMQVKQIGGRWQMLVSYWDAGQVLLDVTDPEHAVRLARSVFASPDLAGFSPSEGNSHQSYWSADSRWVLSTDEDFSPIRTRLRITSGPNAGEYDASQAAFTLPLPIHPATGATTGLATTHRTVFGGSGCAKDVDGDGIADRTQLPLAASVAADTVVFVRGGCTNAEKAESAQARGYALIVVGNHHAGSRFPDTLSCAGGRPAGPVAVAGVCVGHRTLHLLFDDPPDFVGAAAEGFSPDLPKPGTPGREVVVDSVFDGWGYVRLHEPSTLREVGAYTIPQARDRAYAAGFGPLTVHEVKTDPRPGVDLAYASWYAGGLRVLRFDDGGLREVGHYIAEGGNVFWGVFPVLAGTAPTGGGGSGSRPLLLLSDVDSGLWIFRYTGPE